MALTVGFFVFLIPALSLIIDSGYSYGSALITLLALFFAPRLRHYFKSLDVEDKLLISSFVVYFFLFALSIGLDGWHTRELGRPSRFLFAAIALILLLKIHIAPSFLLAGIITGAAGTGILALYQYYWLDIPRPSGHQIVIAFGNDSLLLGLLAICCLGLMAGRSIYLKAIVLISAALALTAFVLSGTRGGWLAVPLIFFIAWHYRSMVRIRTLLACFAIALLFFSALLLIPGSSGYDRIKLASNNLYLYFKGDKAATSTGLRLEMWTSSIYSFKENPLLGTGQYGNKESKQRQIEQGLVIPEISDFGHAHSETLTTLSHRGIVGLLSLLSIYFIPLLFFYRRLSSTGNIHAFALGGCVLVLSYFIYGLTQAMFFHNSGVVIYAFYIIIFWATIRSLERQSTQQSTLR